MKWLLSLLILPFIVIFALIIQFFIEGMVDFCMGEFSWKAKFFAIIMLFLIIVLLCFTHDYIVPLILEHFQKG